MRQSKYSFTLFLLYCYCLLLMLLVVVVVYFIWIERWEIVVSFVSLKWEIIDQFYGYIMRHTESSLFLQLLIVINWLKKGNNKLTDVTRRHRLLKHKYLLASSKKRDSFQSAEAYIVTVSVWKKKGKTNIDEWFKIRNCYV